MEEQAREKEIEWRVVIAKDRERGREYYLEAKV